MTVDFKSLFQEFAKYFYEDSNVVDDSFFFKVLSHGSEGGSCWGPAEPFKHDVDLNKCCEQIEEFLVQKLSCSQTLGMILSRLGKPTTDSWSEYYGNSSTYVGLDFSFDLLNKVYEALKDKV